MGLLTGTDRSYYAGSQQEVGLSSFDINDFAASISTVDDIYVYVNNTLLETSAYSWSSPTIVNPVIDYIRIPNDPKWDYSVNSGQYTFKEVGVGDSTSVDFELHVSDETDLVLKVLALAGVIIKDPTIVQVAQQQEINNINQENA